MRVQEQSLSPQLGDQLNADDPELTTLQDLRQLGFHRIIINLHEIFRQYQPRLDVKIKFVLIAVSSLIGGTVSGTLGFYLDK